jgi:hypothetical protein
MNIEEKMVGVTLENRASLGENGNFPNVIISVNLVT